MNNDQFPMTMHDATGRKVMTLKPGDNDIRHLVPGVYFVRRDDRSVARVVLLR